MFDPYHKWLGIPKEQRPPTYYQLLGVSPTEHDLEVIEEAAVRQSAHVRTYSSDPHAAADCARLLKEIARARQTLLDVAKRKQYDEHLAKVADDRSKAPRPATHAHSLTATAGKSAMPSGLLIGIGAALGLLVLLAVVGAVVLVWLAQGPAKIDGGKVAVHNADDHKQPIREEEKPNKDKEDEKQGATKSDPEAKQEPPKKTEVEPKPDPAKKADDPKKPDPDLPPRKDGQVSLVVDGRGAPRPIVDLPRTISGLSLMADGMRVAYSRNEGAFFCYREGPQFLRERSVQMDSGLVFLMPHGTSPDGKKMTLVASDGKTWQVLVWNWTTMKVEAALPTNGQSLRVTLAPDGKHVAAFANLEAPGAPREHWVHLFRIDGNAREVKRWKLDAPLGHFGFTSDGDQFFFAHEAQAPAVTYSLTTGAAGQLPIAAARQRVAFSRDFERFAVWTTPNSLSIQSWANRLLGTVQGQFRGIDAAAFSADNRFLLIGMHSGQGKDAEARAALVDLNNQGVVSVTDTFVGVPDGVQLARNGIALIAGESVLPRLVRFPGVAPAPVLDAQPGPSFTLTERNPVAPQLLFQMTKDMDVVHLGPDGRRLVLTRFKTDATSYRQAPAFDMDLPLIVPGKRKYVHGSGFTPDGKWMAIRSGLTGSSVDSPFAAKVLLWDWDQMTAMSSIPTATSVAEAIPSPDRKYVATRRTDGTGAGQRTSVEVHRIGPPAQVVRDWEFDLELQIHFGFSADSSKFFVQSKNFTEETLRTWSIADQQVELVELAPIMRHFFSADFSVYARIDSETTVRVRAVDPACAIVTLSPPRSFQPMSVDFSPDKRFALLGGLDRAGGKLNQGRVLLVDLTSGEVVSALSLAGYPNRLQLAANGTALIRENTPALTLRLYHFPVGPNATFLKLDAPK